MRDKVLIVGGYGQVGKYVALELAEKFPRQIVIAGRNAEKAEAFAKQHGNLLETLKLDIYDTDNISESMKNIKIAVMCVSPENNAFPKFCINNGIHYIDISPSNDVAQGIEQLKENAAESKSTCVLGVGLAPGLSNLLVKKVINNIDTARKVSIFLMLGLGEAHGQDGVNR